MMKRLLLLFPALLISCTNIVLNESSQPILLNGTAKAVISNGVLASVEIDDGTIVEKEVILKFIEDVCASAGISTASIEIELSDEFFQSDRGCISHKFHIEDVRYMGQHSHAILVKPGIYDFYECDVYKYFYECSWCGLPKTKFLHSALGIE